MCRSNQEEEANKWNPTIKLLKPIFFLFSFFLLSFPFPLISNFQAKYLFLVFKPKCDNHNHFLIEEKIVVNNITKHINNYQLSKNYDVEKLTLINITNISFMIKKALHNF